jgi:hypothetical protein
MDVKVYVTGDSCQMFFSDAYANHNIRYTLPELTFWIPHLIYEEIGYDTRLLPSVAEWCDMSLKFWNFSREKSEIHLTNSGSYNQWLPIIHFENLADYVLFKLRWM